MENEYNPKNIEEKIYRTWKKNNYFKCNYTNHRKNFCIMMPPPNITGNLHMGHAFQQTIIDILIRYFRMQGHNTLWQMGLDHAGIATQILVMKKIEIEENKNINDIGKVNFIKKCLKWKKEISKKINYQIQRLGSSVDWNRTRFTLDKASRIGVKKVFIDLYNNKLIYRKKKLCNWDIKLQTVISDLEIEHKTIIGNMWYIKYAVVYNRKMNNKDQFIIVATTRPETLLGDTAIAVHPHDKRYKKFIGCYAIVPIINRKIPIIADRFVEINKGTGCVKITPAHDFNDYAIAVQHKLLMINIFTTTGLVSKHATVYDSQGDLIHLYNESIPKILQGKTRLLARKIIVNILKEKSMLYQVLKTETTVLYGDRSGEILEPMLTNQWYLRTKKLAKQAISVVNNQKINFIPVQYKNMYLSWMYNIQDWCISRQLLWGHRIPVWYDLTGKIYVGYNEYDIRKRHNINDNIPLKQDPDVLDTWFSSSLWTFLSLDWPKEKKLLKNFHPTSVLISGFDIIFFWIARMIMMTMYTIKDHHGNAQIPFKTVYITGLIKDEQGKKMSKSQGNVLDPLDIIDGISLDNLLKKRMSNNIKNNLEKKIYRNTKDNFPDGILGFGADALRFTFTSLSSHTRSINWDMNRLKGYRNFCNKIWNASKFILLNISKKQKKLKKNMFCIFDIWILVELNDFIKIYRDALDTYRFDLAANALHNFFWHKFCDWYIEFVKIFFKIGSLTEIEYIKCNLIYVFEILLRIAHPIIPFITEYIWIKIMKTMNVNAQTIMLQKFPNFNDNMGDNSLIVKTVYFIQKIILFIRKVRIELNMKYNDLLCFSISNITENYKKYILSYTHIIKKMSYLSEVKIFHSDYNIPENSFIQIVEKINFFIEIDKSLYLNFFLKKIDKEINLVEKKIQHLNDILKKKKFIQCAEEEIISKKRKELKILILHRKNLVKKKNKLSY
ncbi:valine--tRNA ligase [Buchnera aphidicola]|uniref:valine--tRNA ligase n=1 Tax=Buchnera aphidicola TaxID=9 RepID=UPI0031B875D3